jgi:hypothetical protein
LIKTPQNGESKIPQFLWKKPSRLLSAFQKKRLFLDAPPVPGVTFAFVKTQSDAGRKPGKPARQCGQS